MPPHSGSTRRRVRKPSDSDRATAFSRRSRLPAASASWRLARIVDFSLGEQLFTREEPTRYLYFLTSGIASTVFISENGTSVELSTQGYEGLTGISYLLGPELSQGDCSIQVAGAAYRVPFAVMQREFRDSHEVRSRLLEYAQHQMIFLQPGGRL